MPDAKNIQPQDMQKLRERGATALFTPLAKELFLGVLPGLDGLMFGFPYKS